LAPRLPNVGTIHKECPRRGVLVRGLQEAFG
jgi:hypothetical protein